MLGKRVVKWWLNGGGTDNDYHYGVAASLATHYEALFVPVRTRIALTRNPGKACSKTKAKPAVRHRCSITKARPKQSQQQDQSTANQKKNCDGGIT